jgi:hypothetical protein
VPSHSSRSATAGTEDDEPRREGEGEAADDDDGASSSASEEEELRVEVQDEKEWKGRRRVRFSSAVAGWDGPAAVVVTVVGVMIDEWKKRSLNRFTTGFCSLISNMSNTPPLHSLMLGKKRTTRLFVITGGTHLMMSSKSLT